MAGLRKGPMNPVEIGGGMRRQWLFLTCFCCVAWARDLQAIPIWVNDAFGVLHSVDSNTGIPTAVGTMRQPGGPVLNFRGSGHVGAGFGGPARAGLVLWTRV